MKIARDQYALTEVAREFVGNQWGHEDTLLGCLQQGQLIANIIYPIDSSTVRQVPKQYWVDFPLAKFDVMNESNVRINIPLSYSIQSDCLAEEERPALRSIANAAVEHDATLIAKNVQSAVLTELGIKDFNGFDDWLNLVRVFHELSNEFEEDDDEYPVFVLHDQWEGFRQGFAPSSDNTLQTAKQGAPRNPNWEFLFAYILIHIADKQGKTISELAGCKNPTELATDMLKWAKDVGLVTRVLELPSEDAVVKRLGSMKKGKYKQ